MVILAAVEEEVGVGVAARADDVVHTGAIRVPSVPIERIGSDRRHRAHIGERAPQPIAGRHMRRVDGAGLAAEEALGKIMRVPEIETPTCGPSMLTMRKK